MRQWQDQLAMLSGVSDLPDWKAPSYQRWQLIERRVLNPGSVGEPCFHLALQPLHDGINWQAGDLVDMVPSHASDKVAQWLSAHMLDTRVPVACSEGLQPLGSLLAHCRLPETQEVDGLDEDAVASMLQRLAHREHSIASLPADGAIHLLVRQMRGHGGDLGIGSGWLTRYATTPASTRRRMRGH